jgi:hypothetical protein
MVRESRANGPAACCEASASSRERYDSGQAERLNVIVGKTQASREGRNVVSADTATIGIVAKVRRVRIADVQAGGALYEKTRRILAGSVND